MTPLPSSQPHTSVHIHPHNTPERLQGNLSVVAITLDTALVSSLPDAPHVCMHVIPIIDIQDTNYTTTKSKQPASTCMRLCICVIGSPDGGVSTS